MRNERHRSRPCQKWVPRQSGGIRGTTTTFAHRDTGIAAAAVVRRVRQSTPMRRCRKSWKSEGHGGTDEPVVRVSPLGGQDKQGHPQNDAIDFHIYVSIFQAQLSCLNIKPAVVRREGQVEKVHRIPREQRRRRMGGGREE